MFKFILSLFVIFLLIQVNGQTQSVVKERTIQPAGKSLGVFSVFGIKSVVNGSGPNGYGLTPAIEFKGLKDDGFVIRNGYKFTKYNDNFQKVWSREIDKVYGLQAQPNAEIVGAKGLGMYFIQCKRHPSFTEIHISRFDSIGNIKQIEFKTEKKHDDILYSYVNQNGLNLITYFINKRERKINYSLITFSISDLSYVMKPIILDFDEYEVDNVVPYPNYLQQSFFYTFLKDTEDKIILKKTYFKDIAKSKKKELILKTVELSYSGNVFNPKTFTFSVNDSKFFDPTIALDSNDIYVFGYLTVKASNQFVDGFYYYKFDYGNSTNIFSKQIEFKNISELTNFNGDQKEKIHKSFSQIYPIGKFSKGTYSLDCRNHILTLYIFNKANGFFKDNLTVNTVSLNTEGSIVEIDQISYLNPVYGFPEYSLTPASFIELYKIDSFNKRDALSYINSLAGLVDPNYLLWTIVERRSKNYDILISVKEGNSEIKAIKLEY